MYQCIIWHKGKSIAAYPKTDSLEEAQQQAYTYNETADKTWAEVDGWDITIFL